MVLSELNTDSALEEFLVAGTSFLVLLASQQLLTLGSFWKGELLNDVH